MSNLSIIGIDLAKRIFHRYPFDNHLKLIKGDHPLSKYLRPVKFNPPAILILGWGCPR